MHKNRISTDHTSMWNKKFSLILFSAHKSSRSSASKNIWKSCLHVSLTSGYFVKSKNGDNLRNQGRWCLENEASVSEALNVTFWLLKFMLLFLKPFTKLITQITNKIHLNILQFPKIFWAFNYFIWGSYPDLCLFIDLTFYFFQFSLLRTKFSKKIQNFLSGRIFIA